MRSAPIVNLFLTASPFRTLLVWICLCLPGVFNPHPRPNAVPGGQIQAPGEASPRPDIVLESPSAPFTFVAYADTQFTDPARTNKSHPRYRVALLEKIAAENPAFLLIAGDVVQRGSDPRDWRIFDVETAPLRERQVRIFPVLGNHDLAGDEQAALANYFRRFPELRRKRWYSVRLANCYFLMIDTEADHSEGSEQHLWLKARLAALPAGIDYVFLVSHRPLYTQASGGLFQRSPRARGWSGLSKLLEDVGRRTAVRVFAISGHVHNYERYRHGTVTYIVSGGGGGTPRAVQRAPGDFYGDPGPTYHYCRFTVDRHHLKFEMVKVVEPNGARTWAVGDTFVLRSHHPTEIGRIATAIP